MKLVSIKVGLPREVEWKGKLVRTSIFKAPVAGRVRVSQLSEFVVTQLRMPCFKLGIRFNRSDMVKRFLQSGRTGFYFTVLKEGEVAAGDSIELLERDEHNIPVADVVNLYRGDATNQDMLRRVSELPSLPNSWRVLS
jgi:MOSC domain-containing protein YiiM